ncbi:MAG: tryptophan synthase subunit alpha [Gammaproteobacteria bacterium]|nr:tryptophan synthase subunit alpha [Gammaproteobacteria bacterium]MYC53149.1 tryptophan synthase subunit alpha [Gammaproteobacteria bacterium]
MWHGCRGPKPMSDRVHAGTGMSLAQCFAGCRAERRAALIPFLTCGYPDGPQSLELLRGMADAGADIIELGIPFSDPLADGPTIQRSSFRALEGGMSTEGTLDVLRAFRAGHDTPVVLFGYLNPILRYGVDEFARAAIEAGAQGLLLTDVPAGSDPVLEKRLAAHGLALIRLIAPTTSPERITVMAGAGAGFLYYISRTGITGARAQLRRALGREVEAVKRRAGGIPVVVGFGISTPAQAADVAAVADGVVVGSALIDRCERDGAEGVQEFVAALRGVMQRDGPDPPATSSRPPHPG